MILALLGIDLWASVVSYISNVSSLMVYSRQRLYGHWSIAWYPCHDKFTGVQWPTNKKLSPTLNSTKCQSSHVIWFATMNVNLLPRSTSKLETHLDLISSSNMQDYNVKWSSNAISCLCDVQHFVFNYGPVQCPPLVPVILVKWRADRVDCRVVSYSGQYNFAMNDGWYIYQIILFAVSCGAY